MKKANYFKAFFMVIPMFFRVSPALFITFSIACCIHGVARAFLVPATQIFLDRAVDFTMQKIELPGVIAGLALLTSAHVCRQLMHGVHHVILIMQWRRAEGAFALEMHTKLSKIPPVVFEDTQMLDDMNKAMQGKDEAVWYAGNIYTVFVFYIPYFIFMAFYFMHIKPVLIALLAIGFAPTILAYVFRTKVFANAEDKAAPIRREFDYCELCMTGREYFKETRILGAFSYFRKQYSELLSILNRLVFQATVKSCIAELLMKLLTLGSYIGALLLLFDLLMKGDIGVGAFAAIFTSMDMVFSLMEELIYSTLGESAKNLSRVQNYLRFLQMPEREGEEMVMPMDVGIVLHNVSFTYPGAAHKAVDSVSVAIRVGETVAVVGENGSGKTTLVRLITGLYLPGEGNILYGDTNSKTASAPSLFKSISAVFQKYQRYQMTLRDNIGISNTGGITGGLNGAKSEAGAINGGNDDYDLDKACASAGINKYDDSLTDGYETMLSREFDGVDLSGGQWQRVAIARSFFRPHRFIVLDEPTAAIDPVEETKIYNRFADISRGKTAIIVTHRLGSVRLADRILVMKQGRLVEQGAHAELMAAGGEYARLYKSQEQWYR